MPSSLPVLDRGRCERLKASVHGVAVGVAALCAAYNFAAWIVRRQRHSVVNAGVYTVLAAWECVHVRHHIRSRPATTASSGDRFGNLSTRTEESGLARRAFSGEAVFRPPAKDRARFAGTIERRAARNG
jgi:hypothetical protein